MGLFKKEERTVRVNTYRICMNATGKAADPFVETPVIQNESELLAIVEGEQRFPKLRVARVERLNEKGEVIWPQGETLGD